MEASVQDRSSLPINRERLSETLEASARIGSIPGGGLARLALSEADGEMRDLFTSWCEDAGLAVSVDRIGNVFARRAGEDPAAAPVALGSHLDTQVHGGRFDGILGVLAGLEIARALNDADIRTVRPVEIVSWTDEEGARFQRSMLGSSVFTGALALDEALARIDDRGVTVGEALESIGYAGTAAVPGHSLHAYLELHIEQGPTLDEAGIDVGIVDSSYPICHLDVHFEGRTAHSGPTPMAKRRNALTGAAHAIVAVDGIARAHGPDAKSTASTIRVWPNRSGIVASSVDVRFDFRHPSEATLAEMAAEIEKAVAGAAAAANVTAEVVARTRFGDAGFDARVVEALERGARSANVPALRLPTQAGHDSLVLASVAPTAMLFCPCRDGVSHHPDEDVELDRVMPAVAVLADASLELAGIHD